MDRHRPLRSRPSRGIAAIGIALVAVAGLLAGCGSKTTAAGGDRPSTHVTSPRPAFPLTLTDDDGVPVTFASPPARIVTFAPSNTEIVYALGLGSRLVGVSGRYDDYPPAARSVPEVGGAGEFGVDPNIEKVVSLHPDLVLTISGGEQWKARLRSLGIRVFTINATNFADLLHDIRTVGQVTGTARQAEELVARMSTAATQVQAKVANEPRVSCFFEAYYPPLTSVGPNTFIFDLLSRAGCDPVTASAKSDYPAWSVERLVTEAPAVYLVASESGVSAAAVAKRPGYDAIAAVRQGRVYLVSSDLASRPGPRVVDGLMAFARVLHPDAFP